MPDTQTIAAPASEATEHTLTLRDGTRLQPQRLLQHRDLPRVIDVVLQHA